MSRKSKINRAQNNGQGNSPLSPEVLPPSAGAGAPVHAVEGRRLREETEMFVVESPQPGAPNEVEEPGADNSDREECQHCDGLFLESAFDDNDGFCPGCGRNEDGYKREDDPPELSEAEQLLTQVANDDEYHLRVARLDDYDNDPRTDSRARMTFCTNLKPVTLDYLDIVRRSFGGGAYYFSMYKKGRPGFIKTWVEIIAKPLQPIESNVQQATTGAASPAPAVSGLDEITKSLDVIKQVWTVMSPKGRTTAEVSTNQGPTDPLKLVEDSFDRVDAWRKRLGLPDPTVAALTNGGERNWVTDLTTFLSATGVGEGIKQFVAPVGQVLGHLTAGAIAAAAQKQAEVPDVAGETKTPAPPAAPQTQAPGITLPAPAMPLLSAIVGQMTSAAPVEKSVEMTLSFVESAQRVPGAKEQVLAFIDKEIITKPPIKVALWLAQGNPAWAYILDLQHAAAWIDAYQEMLREALQAELESQATDTADESSAADVGKIIESVAGSPDSQTTESNVEAPAS